MAKPRTIIHDDGRCIIRKVRKGRYTGLRLPSLEVIHRSEPAAIKMAHDEREARERRIKAGIFLAKSDGLPKRNHSKKEQEEINRKRKAELDFMHEWLTKRWGT